MWTLLQKRLDRLRAGIAASPPFDLDQGLRTLLVHYFFHVSDRGRMELMGEGAPVLNLLTPTHFKGAGRIRLARTTVRCATFAGQLRRKLYRVPHARLLD